MRNSVSYGVREGLEPCLFALNPRHPAPRSISVKFKKVQWKKKFQPAKKFTNEAEERVFENGTFRQAQLQQTRWPPVS